MKHLSQQKELVLTFLLALFCLYDLSKALFEVWNFTTDDAYIAWVYARQLVDGKGLFWHDSLPKVEGYSNFLWVMMAAAVMKLQLPLVNTMKILSCFSLAGGLYSLYRLGLSFFSPLLAILPVLMFSHFIGVSLWTVSGMETSFYCALAWFLTWQCTVALGYGSLGEIKYFPKTFFLSTPAWICSNITLLLLSLTRFEGIIWAIPVALLCIFQIKQYGWHTLFPDSNKLWLWGSISLFCWILPYTLYFIWRWHYFGHLIPNSYSCKAYTQGHPWILDVDYCLITIPLAIVSLPYWFTSKDSRHWLLWVPSVLYVLLLWNANPVVAYFLRLFLAPIALFFVLPVLGIRCLLDNFKIENCDTKLITALIIFILTWVFLPGNDRNYLREFTRHYKEKTQIRLAVADILNKQASNNAKVLLGDDGLIPFESRKDLIFIDAECLNNSELGHAPYKNNLELYANRIRSKIKPEWIIINNEPLAEEPENRLFKILKQTGSLSHYRLVAQLRSGRKLGNGENSKRVIDYAYDVYTTH